ncbi:MAG TPA: N,N-dimethylformamidase beta subunit family domain-containing protein [Ilumatobacter sp.]|nr:N,N-dimethylformamidase beta subunit family domain-containing protein [Ilumatobacter sp.]
MADDITHYDAIEGYAQHASCLPGDVVQLCTSTTSRRFDVEVHRWGVARELVWSAHDLAGREQATPADADAAGCGWEPLVEIPTQPSWRSGFYLVTMRAHDAPADRAVAYAGFVVRARTPGRALFVLATNTWNAYNNWGGRSLYTGGKEVSFRRPWGRGMLVRPEVDREDRKSPPLRPHEQPDVDGDMYQTFRYEHGFPGYMGSAGWFTYERRFAEWAERSGVELDYAISSDLEQVDGITDGHRLVIGAGHDEYWSAPARETIERFVAGGGNYASFSGNTMFWQVRLERAGTSMVCHKYTAHDTDPIVARDPAAMTGMWSDPIVGRTERGLLGAASMYGLYARFGRATPRGVPGFVVYRPEHWLLEGTGLRYGDVLGADDGVVGYETVGTRIAFDDLNLPLAIRDPDIAHDALPEDVEVVAMTPVSNLGMEEYPASIAALDDQGDLEFVAERMYGGGERALAKARHGNAVMLTCRPFGASAGQVVTAGSTDWVFGLARDRDVQRVTANVLRLANDGS